MFHLPTLKCQEPLVFWAFMLCINKLTIGDRRNGSYITELLIFTGLRKIFIKLQAPVAQSYPLEQNQHST